jgi:hypothetical protein
MNFNYFRSLFFYLFLIVFSGCLHQFWEDSAPIRNKDEQRLCLNSSTTVNELVNCVPEPVLKPEHPAEKYNEKTYTETREEPDPNDITGQSTVPVQYECLEEGFKERSNIKDISPVDVKQYNQLWPGALVEGKSVKDGSLSPIFGTRRPVTITIKNIFFEDPNVSYSRTIEDPTYENIQGAILNILNEGGENSIAAKIHYNMKKFRVFNQVRVGINAAVTIDLFVAYARGEVDLSGLLSVDFNHLIVKFNQAFFTIVFETPEMPNSVFDDNINLDDLRTYITPDNPPAYVSSVTYGRSMTLIFSSLEEMLGVEAAVKATFSVLGIPFSKSWRDSVNVHFNQTYLTLYSLDENAQELFENYVGLKVDAGFGETGEPVHKVLELVNDYLAQGTQLSSGYYGRPISYQVRWLRNNEPGRLSLAADYKEKTCAPVN